MTSPKWRTISTVAHRTLFIGNPVTTARITTFQNQSISTFHEQRLRFLEFFFLQNLRPTPKFFEIRLVQSRFFPSVIRSVRRTTDNVNNSTDGPLKTTYLKWTSRNVTNCLTEGIGQELDNAIRGSAGSKCKTGPRNFFRTF